MTITMNDSHMTSIAQLLAFEKLARGIEFQAASQAEKYAWIAEVLTRFSYQRLRKKDKSTVRKYIRKMTEFSRSQLTRLIKKKKKCGIILASIGKRHSFEAVYTTDDVALLAETDLAHSRLSGPATKKILKRSYEIFGDQNYEYIRFTQCKLREAIQKWNNFNSL